MGYLTGRSVSVSVLLIAARGPQAKGHDVRRLM